MNEKNKEMEAMSKLKSINKYLREICRVNKLLVLKVLKLSLVGLLSSDPVLIFIFSSTAVTMALYHNDRVSAVNGIDPA